MAESLMCSAERFGMPKAFLTFIHPAYDLSSGGVNVHLCAMRKYFTSNQKLSSVEWDSLRSRGANLLVQPYVAGWALDDAELQILFPNNPCPDTADQRILFQYYRYEYDHLKELKRKTLLQPATHKLAAMLQIIYDAKVSGEALPASYKPPGFEDAVWIQLFGKPVPTIEELVNETHRALVEFATPQDPLISHLLKPPKLSGLLV